MALAIIRPILKKVKIHPMDLIRLAIMESRLRQTNRAIKLMRQRIAAGMPEGARLALTARDIRRLVREHNKHCAKRGAGISIPTWLVAGRQIRLVRA